MRTLAAVNSIFAVALLLLGLVALFALGITGAIFIVPALVLALLAAVTYDGSRTAVALTLAADCVFGYMAIRNFRTAWIHESELGRFESGKTLVINAFAIDMIVSIAIVALVACAFIAVAFDWRRMRETKWF